MSEKYLEDVGGRHLVSESAEKWIVDHTEEF